MRAVDYAGGAALTELPRADGGRRGLPPQRRLNLENALGRTATPPPGAAACSHRGAARSGAKGKAVPADAPRSPPRWCLFRSGVFGPSGLATIRGHGWRRTALGRMFALCARGQVRPGRTVAVAVRYERVDPPPPPTPPPIARVAAGSIVFSAAPPAWRATDVSPRWRKLSRALRALPYAARPAGSGNTERPSKLRPRSAAKRRYRAAHTLALFEFQGKTASRRRLLLERRACFFPARGPLVLPIAPGWAR